MTDDKERVLLSECTVRTKNKLAALMREANRLGIDGHVVLDIEVVQNEREVMTVKIYGVKGTV